MKQIIIYIVIIFILDNGILSLITLIYNNLLFLVNFYIKMIIIRFSKYKR